MVGSKHASRMIAARAARETGVDAGRIEHMLPEIAAVAMGGLSRQTLGPLGDILSQLPGSAGGGARDGMPEQRPLPMPGEPAGGGGRQTDWQADWSGGSTDHAPPPPSRRHSRRRPLAIRAHCRSRAAHRVETGDHQIPGAGDGPGYRDLSDILRRHGGRLPRQSSGPGGSIQGGGSLWSLVRQIIASSLGFKNGGVVSWIVRLVLFRVLWPILKRMVLGSLGSRDNGFVGCVRGRTAQAVGQYAHDIEREGRPIAHEFEKMPARSTSRVSVSTAAMADALRLPSSINAISPNMPPGPTSSNG